jgi:RES domain-containing protein
MLSNMPKRFNTTTMPSERFLVDGWCTTWILSTCGLGQAGRCNPDGVKRLYLSVEKETAQAEFGYYATQDGVDPDLAECYSFAAKVKVERVLDLTSKAVRKQVGISLREIEADWKGKHRYIQRMSDTRRLRYSRQSEAD